MFFKGKKSKSYSSKLKESRKRTEATYRKQNKMVDLNPTMSITALNIKETHWGDETIFTK